MINHAFTNEGWEDYIYWQSQDKKTLKRINNLIKDIKRSPFEDIGSPETLKYELSGYWSREINSKDRLVYRFLNDELFEISQCRGHYFD